MYYICIITAVDYYTMYEGYEIVKASSSAEAKDKAKKQYIKKGNHDGFTAGYMFVENVILCSDKKPKEV